MYLRRMRGPVSVPLPGGGRLTRADLPPPDTRRWVASRKAAVACAVIHGLVTADEACERYGLSGEELRGWCETFTRHGAPGLRITLARQNRQP